MNKMLGYEKWISRIELRTSFFDHRQQTYELDIQRKYSL